MTTADVPVAAHGARARRRSALVALVLAALVATGCAQLMAESVEALMKQGVELLNAGKYDEAIAKFLEVVRRDPKSWEGHLYLTRAYLGKRSWLEAIASGRKALELAPNRADVVPALAEALLGAGLDALGRRQFTDAIGHFTEYLNLKPADAQGYLHLGRAFLGGEAYADALNAFLRGLAQAPDAGARAQLLRGLLDGGRQALAAGNAKAAIGLLQEYVRHDTGSAAAYLDLGKAYWQDGSLRNAVGAFQRVLELNPNDAEARQYLRPR